jgi:hypothetical protein
MSEEEEDRAIRELLESIQGLSTSDVATRIGNFRGMLYGYDGVGKTIGGLALLNYIVEPDKTILLLDTSENWLSLNNHPNLKQTKLSDGSNRILRLPYQGETRLHAIAAACEKQISPFDKVGGVQFDELSSMADSMLAGILKIAEARDPSRPQDDATWPEYKQLLRKMKNITNRFAQIEGVHTIGIAHVRTDKAAFNKMQEAPNFTPGVGREIRKPMHLITNVTVTEDGERRFRVQPTDEQVAKCKIGGMAPVVNFGTLATETKKWLGGEGETVELQEVIATPVGTESGSELEEGWAIQ